MEVKATDISQKMRRKNSNVQKLSIVISDRLAHEIHIKTYECTYPRDNEMFTGWALSVNRYMAR